MYNKICCYYELNAVAVNIIKNMYGYPLDESIDSFNSNQYESIKIRQQQSPHIAEIQPRLLLFSVRTLLSNSSLFSHIDSLENINFIW